MAKTVIKRGRGGLIEMNLRLEQPLRESRQECASGRAGRVRPTQRASQDNLLNLSLYNAGCRHRYRAAAPRVAMPSSFNPVFTMDASRTYKPAASCCYIP